MEKLKDIINFFYKYFPFKLDVNKVSNVNGRYINKKKLSPLKEACVSIAFKDSTKSCSWFGTASFK